MFTWQEIGFQAPQFWSRDEGVVSQEAELDRFLASVEKKAFYMARAAVGDRDEALDIVQEAMFTLVRKYSDKDEEQWRPLFYRILQNRITDSHRRSNVRRGLFGSRREDAEDRLAELPGLASVEPASRVQLDESTAKLIDLVAELPLRQQQAFLLRTLEGLSVSETAKAMGCSQGSVKTHYSRAVHGMREQLQEHWS